MTIKRLILPENPKSPFHRALAGWFVETLGLCGYFVPHEARQFFKPTPRLGYF